VAENSIDGQAAHEVADVGDKAEIEHAIGLIEHQYLRAAQVENVLLEVVDEPAGRADQHIAPLAELLALLLVVDATEYHHVPQMRMGAEHQRIVMDLHRKLAGRGHDERAH
jgi:hypothetical protein